MLMATNVDWLVIFIIIVIQVEWFHRGSIIIDQVYIRVKLAQCQKPSSSHHHQSWELLGSQGCPHFSQQVGTPEHGAAVRGRCLLQNPESDGTLGREASWAVWNKSLYHSNPGWLRTGFHPFLAYCNPQYMKGSIIPELIINQQGFLNTAQFFMLAGIWSDFGTFCEDEMLGFSGAHSKRSIA